MSEVRYRVLSVPEILGQGGIKWTIIQQAL
jgi:hypothetical protein